MVARGKPRARTFRYYESAAAAPRVCNSAAPRHLRIVNPRSAVVAFVVMLAGCGRSQGAEISPPPMTPPSSPVPSVPAVGMRTGRQDEYLPGYAEQACLPLDTAAVRRWHTTWDGVPFESLSAVSARDRAVRAAAPAVAEVDARLLDGPLVDHWRITVVLAGRDGPDRQWHGSLRLAPIGSKKGLNEGQAWALELSTGWLTGATLIEAWWYRPADSMPIRATGYRDGTILIADDPPADDGGGLLVRLLTSHEMRGTWWPAGSVLPPYMGWFCAEPVIYSTYDGWGP